MAQPNIQHVASHNLIGALITDPGLVDVFENIEMLSQLPGSPPGSHMFQSVRFQY